MIQAWIIEYIISSFYKNATWQILLSHCGGKCAILWLLSWPIPVFRLLWDFPRFSCEITWLLPTPLLAINKMFEVFARLSSTKGAFQNRRFKIYKSAFFWKITGTETYWDTSETQLKHILITLSNLRMLYLSNWISGMSSIPLYQLNSVVQTNLWVQFLNQTRFTATKQGQTWIIGTIYHEVWERSQGGFLSRFDCKLQKEDYPQSWQISQF